MATKKRRIKNKKLALLSLILIGFFIALGIWQLYRAQQKKILLVSYHARALHTPYTVSDLSDVRDWRFYRVTLTGRFDNAHTFLLDNKTFHEKVGYEVYTPFNDNNMHLSILVDRGFVPIGPSRKILPTIREINGDVTIQGMLNLPPIFFALGEMSDKSDTAWPRRIEFVNLSNISTLIGTKLYPYVLNISPSDPAAYDVEWQIVIMGPERHLGYAVQWFALALTLLIISVVLNRA